MGHKDLCPREAHHRPLGLAEDGMEVNLNRLTPSKRTLALHPLHSTKETGNVRYEFRKGNEHLFLRML